MQNKYTELYHDLILERKAVPQLAMALDLKPSTIYAQLNPYNDDNRFSIDAAITASEVLGDFSPLITALQRNGYQVSRSDNSRPALADATALVEHAEAAAAFGKIADVMSRAIKNDGQIDRTEMLEIFSVAVDAANELQDIVVGAQKAAGEMP